MSIRSNVTAQEQVKEAITNVSFLGTGNTLESDLPSLIEQFDQEYIEVRNSVILVSLKCCLSS